MTSPVLFQDTPAFEAVRDRRDTRHNLRRFLHRNSTNGRVSGCGLCTPGNDVSINVSRAKSGNLVAGASGLITCGSVWACPVCSAKISTERTAIVADAIRRWKASGGDVLFATFTIRHDRTQSLTDVWDALATSWGSFLGGKGWHNLRETWNLSGWIRAVEVTHGANGWHVHAHTAVFVKGAEVTPEYLNAVSDALFHRWSLAVASNGFSTTREAFDCRSTYSDSGLARYLVKSSNTHNPASELTSGALKSAKNGNRTPFAILSDLSKKGSMECACVVRHDEYGVENYRRTCDACLWVQWEKQSAGRRQISYSKGLRDAVAALEFPVSPDTDEPMSDRRSVFLIDPASWRRIADDGSNLYLFRCLERADLERAVSFLDASMLKYRLGPDYHNFRTTDALPPLRLEHSPALC